MKEELFYSDGKNYEKESTETLASLLNSNTNNPFKTLDKENFKEKLSRMRLEEKGNLACQVGVRPTSRQEELDRNLLSAFDRFKKSYTVGLGGSEGNGNITPADKEYADIEHLLKF